MQTEGSAPDRNRGLRIAAIVFGLIFGFALFGFLGLILGWVETGERYAHRFHDIAGGIMNGILIAGGLFALAARPANVALLHQVAVTVGGGVLGAAIALDAVWLGFVSSGILAVAVVLWTASKAFRRRFLRPERNPSPLMGVLAAASLVPLTAYALTMAKLQRIAPPGDSHAAEHHWAAMASLAFAIGLTGLIAAVRMPGWLAVARFAGLAALVFGLASVVFPEFPGSAGDGWGLVALIGGAIWIAVAQWEARRREPVSPPA